MSRRPGQNEEALVRAGRDALVAGAWARHYLAERNVHRPASALGWRLGAPPSA